MRYEVQRELSISITFSEDEANWLKANMQNPRLEWQGDESDSESAYRTQLFETLKKALAK